MKQITLFTGENIPALGLGSWKMGEDFTQRKTEANALRHGLDLGMSLIDTAEMYADAELVVSDAIQGRRNEAFIVSKVLPSNASMTGTIKACERSLKRLSTDVIDMYLLHWSSPHPIEETLTAFHKLVEQGKIRYFGVSNFDEEEMESCWNYNGGTSIACNQILYNLSQRGPEFSLLSSCQDKNTAIMAYSPLNQGKLNTSQLNTIAQRHNATPYQIALAWLLNKENIIAIPKASQISHVNENLSSSAINLTKQDLQNIDALFPAPQYATPLNMI